MENTIVLKNYPNLAKQIGFTFYEGKNQNNGGEISTDDKGTIIIALNTNFEAKSNDKRRLSKIALHELQHGIQGESNGSVLGGTSPQIIYQKLKSA